ncbi:Uncharacterized protein HSRCO_1112 [Halanaeroarchaeum sp. HSR-CO]|uniref:HalOD1 output domain-containing protein n=1 Tax=Halanaeroarchaeum sp. HSR-CO TaxID=2866382 RepID=UPI00217E1FB5|nr:HalOD1 output domain-containing protein [Halanaeroarchaeum sp. HSR-CO]UWG47400.1 Uncharacterized protein HSRCO_1112 [Halanaeroarchaeum sp. HSR-CO]
MAESDCIATGPHHTDVSVGTEDMTVQYDISQTTPVHAIVEALCVARDEAYDELPPLHEFIDTDALNSLLQTDNDARVIFDYQGHTIAVRTDSVTVGPAV